MGFISGAETSPIRNRMTVKWSGFDSDYCKALHEIQFCFESARPIRLKTGVQFEAA